MKKNNGITLIALVITIVILIILAGVAITLSLGQNGIFKKASKAKEDTQVAQNEEIMQIAQATNSIDSAIGTSDRTTPSVTKTVLYDTPITTEQTITLKDDIKKYSYIMITIAWDYRGSYGKTVRDYFYDTDTIDIRENESASYKYDIFMPYGINSMAVSAYFMKDAKCKIMPYNIPSSSIGSVAVTKIIGMK